MIRNRRPTVAEIISELDDPTDEIGFCRHVRDGRFHSWAEPPELFIKAIGGWLRADGSYASFALNGQQQYGRDSRRQLRAAVERWVWRRAHHPPQGDILRLLNGIQQPSDWDGTFNGALAIAMLELMHMKPEIPR